MEMHVASLSHLQAMAFNAIVSDDRVGLYHEWNLRAAIVVVQVQQSSACWQSLCSMLRSQAPRGPPIRQPAVPRINAPFPSIITTRLLPLRQITWTAAMTRTA
jgi:hypothetical protein